MKNNKHTLSQASKGKHKKRTILLATLIPLCLLGAVGGTFGGMAIAKVGPFAPNAQTKITLSNALYGNETHTDVDLNKTYSLTEANVLDEKTLMGELHTWLIASYGDTHNNWFPNQLTIDNIGKNEGSQTAILHAKSDSVNYSHDNAFGKNQMTLKYTVVEKKELTDDLQTTIMPIAEQNDWTGQPTDPETFLQKVKTWSNNSSLNTNQVDVTMTSTAWDGTLNPYSNANDLGAYKVTISVKTGSDVYIDTGIDSSIVIWYRLARVALSGTGWLSNNIGNIYVVPQNDDEAAMLLCDANSRTIDEVEAGGGTFLVTTASQTTGDVAVSINGSSLFNGASFVRTYNTSAKIAITSNTYFAAATGNFFNTGSTATKFNDVPTNIDVINWFNWYTGWHLRTTNSITLVWPDINISITNNGLGAGTITLSGTTGSYIYTTDTVTLDYAYGA